MPGPTPDPMPRSASGSAPKSRVYYGWVIVVASLVLLIGSFGTQISFGVFLKPLADEFGWSRAATSGAMSLLMGVSGVIGMVMGRLSDKYKVRTVIAIGILVGAASYFLLSTMTSLWQLYIYFGVGGGICMGSTYTPVGATISKWFAKKRALALGLALMGIAVGQMIFSPLSAYLIVASSWRTAYFVLGVAVLVCALPALVFMGRSAPSGEDVTQGTSGERRRESPSRAGMTTGQAARTPPFWMLMVTGLVISAGFYMVAAHIVPAATDEGISTTAAALILTVSSVGSLGGTALGWSITVKLGNKNALLLLIAGEALGMFLFIFTKGAWAFYVVAFIFGFSFGGASPVRQAMATPLFGLKAIGAILGFAYLAWSVGGVAGPYLAGLIFDVNESYRLAFLIGGIMLVVGMVSVALFGGHRKSENASPAADRP